MLRARRIRTAGFAVPFIDERCLSPPPGFEADESLKFGPNRVEPGTTHIVRFFIFIFIMLAGKARLISVGLTLQVFKPLTQ